MRLIVGLGNPGEKYQNTRHNLGFEVVDHFVNKMMPANKSGDGFWKEDKKFNAQVGKIDDLDLMVIKPQTFMNSSGMAVAAIAKYFKIVPTDIIVVYDELDLKLGQIKIRMGGSAAGHHGVESIINSLQTDQFLRVRLGIGSIKSVGGERPGGHFQADEYVVADFGSGEKNKVKSLVKKSVEALKTLLEKGLEPAQNQYH